MLKNCLAALAVALLAFGAGTESAGAANSTEYGFAVVPERVSPRETVVVVANVTPGRACHLRVSSQGTFVRSPKERSRAGILQFYWKVPKKAASGRSKLVVLCGSSKRIAAKGLNVVRRSGSNGRAPVAVRIRTHAISSVAPPAITGLGAAGYPTYGSVMIPGSAWFGGKGVNVHSNGSSGNLNGGWQCVELVNRFLTTRGFGPAIRGNADAFYANAPSSHYEKHRNGSGYRPVAGDVIVLGWKDWGHVVVVDTVVGNTVYAVEQNSSSTGRTAFTLKGSTLTRAYGLNVIGILHAKANKAPPATAPASIWSSGWQTVSTSENVLWSTGFDVKGSLNLGVSPGTSPSVAVLKDGSWISAFRGANGNLWVVGSRESKGDMGLGVSPGTSPSITSLANGSWQVAWNSGGELWTTGPTDVRGSLGLGIAPGTNPSITGLAGDSWQIAWNAGGTVWTTGPKDARGDLGLGIQTGTSPSITRLANGSWQIAWNADGQLWSTGPTDPKGYLGVAIAGGTSPSITGLATGSWQVAWNGGGTLWTTGPRDVRGNLGLGIQSGTNPSITGLANGSWVIAWNAGSLWVVGPTVSNGNLGLGMTSGSSPSIGS